MKLNRTYLFIAISSIALFIVLVIQVSWILETAKMKEALFNEKANMVLSKTAEALSADKETCRNLEGSAGTDDARTRGLFLRSKTGAGEESGRGSC